MQPTGNPYAAGPAVVAERATRPTRPTRWLVRIGTVLLCAPVLSLVATAAMVAVTFYSATSGTAPQPEDVARGIYVALILSLLSIPVGVLGIALMAAGFVIRQPEEKRE